MQALQSERLEGAAAALANKVTVVGSAGSFFSWLNSSAFGMWAGILIGVIGLLVNWYFKHQSDKRAKIAHEAWLKKLTTNSHLSPLEVKGLQDD